MPLQSEIIQRLSADNSNYRSVMNQSELVADKTGKSILKKLDIKAGVAAVAFAVGFSINSIAEGIARLVSESTKEAEDALASVLKLGEETARIYDEIYRKRRSDQQNIESDLQKQNRLLNEQKGILAGVAAQQSEIDAKNKLIARERATREMTGSLVGGPQLIGPAGATEKQQVRLAEIAKELAALQQTIDETKKARDTKAERDKEEAHKKELEYLKEETDAGLRWYDKRISLENQLRDQKVKGLGDEEKIKFLNEEITKWKREQAKLDKDSNEFKALQVKINDNNLEIESAQKDIAIAKVKAEKEITAEKTKQYDISSKGRGDTQLSDRELERKISNIQSELSAAGVGLGAFQGAGGALNSRSDFLTAQQRGAANQAQTELDFRRQVRQAASQFGEDAAFKQFSGLTEQRFREILQSAPGTQDVVAELKKLNGQLSKGVPTVLFGSEQ